MTEAKNIATSNATKERIYLKKFVTDLRVIPMILDLIPFLSKNHGVKSTTERAKVSSKVEAPFECFYLIKEIITKGDVIVERVSSTDNISDPLIKPLN